jgi:hypothetical protein
MVEAREPGKKNQANRIVQKTIGEAYAAMFSIQGHCATCASSSRFNTTAKASKTVEAHAGQFIAEFPTELQSWQR